GGLRPGAGEPAGRGGRAGVLAVGVVAQVTHIGLFFLPALVVLAVAAVKLRREQTLAAREKVWSDDPLPDQGPGSDRGCPGRPARRGRDLAAVPLQLAEHQRGAAAGSGGRRGGRDREPGCGRDGGDRGGGLVRFLLHAAV